MPRRAQRPPHGRTSPPTLRYAHLMDKDQRFTQAAAELGYSFDGEIKIGGHYVPLVREGNTVYLSGQIPRVGDVVVVQGRAGDTVSLPQAQHAARVCVMRALALHHRTPGGRCSSGTDARPGYPMRWSPPPTAARCGAGRRTTSTRHPCDGRQARAGIACYPRPRPRAHARACMRPAIVPPNSTLRGLP